MLTLIILCSIGSGNVWGETITLTQSTLGLTGSYTTNTTKAVSNVDFTYTDLMKNSSNIQAKASSGTIYNSSLVPGKITKVQITHSGTARSTTIAMGTSTSNYTAGTYSGSGSIYLNGPANTCCGYFKITRGSSDAYWTQVVVTYTPATITLSESSITGLNYAVGGGPSAAQTFTVSGSNIPANLTVTAPTNFEVSLDGSSWASSKTINVTLTGSASAGTLSSTPVYVRLASGKSAGNYSGNVSIAMAGCKTISSVNPKTVAVSGTVSAASYTVGWSITDGGGTLSTTSGMSTTVTPASGYRYASPAYTVLTGSATVVRSSNTFSATPTDNSTIRINMEQIPSHNIIFNTGGLVAIPSASVLEGATYDITEDPSASLSDGCEYSTFVGWTTASSIADPSISPSIITSYTMSTSDVTLYAVYSKTTGGSGATVGTTMFSEDWTGDTGGNTPSSPTAGGSVVYNSANITYTWADGGSTTQTYVDGGPNDNENILVSKGSGYWKVSGIPTGGATTLTVSYAKSGSGSITLSTSTTNVSISGTTVTIGDPANISSFDLTFTNTLSSNCRVDDISVVVATTTSGGTTTYSLSANCNMPTITVSKTSIDFGDVKVGGSYTETFTVSGENLTGAINLAVSGAQAGRYSVSPTTLSPTAGTVAETTITVTFAPTAASDHAAQVDITSLGATSKTVTLHAISQWEVTWMNNGVQYQTTLTTEVGGHHRPVLPTPNPSSCDGTSTTFRGWTQTPWSGKQSQSYVDGLTTDATKVFLDNTAMPDVSSNSVVYHAVFVKATGSDESDVINYSATSSQLGEQSTTAYQSNFTITGSTGAQYRIHSMGTGSGVALRWNSNGFLYCTSAPTSGAKLSSVTITTTADKSIGVYASTSAYSGDAKPTATSLGTVTATSSGATKNITADTYSYIGLVGTTSSTIISSITITYGGTTYSDYLTTCCTSYDITLSGGGTVSGGTFSASVPSACAGNEVTLSNSICSGYTVGAWTITKTSNGDDVTASVLEGNTLTMPAYGVTVALSTTAKVDHFIDDLHNTAGYTGTGATVTGCNQTVPNLSDKSAPSDETCEQLHYKFVGWVDEDHIDSDGTLLSGYSIVSGGTTSWNATGTNYYAIWAKEL